MNVEQLLARGLAEEAEARQVDIHALHREVERRVEQARPRRRTFRLVAAAALVVAGAAAALVLRDAGDDRSGRFVDEAPGDVATAFACPVVTEIDFLTTDDDGFLPDLADGRSPGEVARDERAPTFDFTTAGDTATLRLGNADGSLGSIVTYARVKGAWQMRTARVCAGSGDQPLAPVDDALRLGEHGAEPWPAEHFHAHRGGPAAFVDDRPYYNLAGILEGHRSLYVRPCGQDRWCWVSGEPDSFLVADPVRSSQVTGRPHDVSDMLVDPDLMVGRKNALGVWAHDLRGGGTFAARLEDGTTVPATEVTHAAWGGRRVLVVLALRSDVSALELTDEAGEVTRWKPAALAR